MNVRGCKISFLRNTIWIGENTLMPSLILRRSRSLAVTHSLPSPSDGLHSRSCSWRHDALVLSAPIATLVRIGQKWNLRARYSKLYFLKFLISENVTFDLIGGKNKGVMTPRTWPWMKSIRRGRERVRDRERPGPSENQANWCQERGMNFYWQRQISQSDCEITSNCGKIFCSYRVLCRYNFSFIATFLNKRIRQ